MSKQPNPLFLHNIVCNCAKNRLRCMLGGGGSDNFFPLLLHKPLYCQWVSLGLWLLFSWHKHEMTKGHLWYFGHCYRRGQHPLQVAHARCHFPPVSVTSPPLYHHNITIMPSIDLPESMGLLCSAVACGSALETPMVVWKYMGSSASGTCFMML